MGWALGLVALLASHGAPAQGIGGYEPDYEAISQVGSTLFDAFATEEMKANYQVASADEMRSMTQGYMRAFASESLAEIAALRDMATAFVQNERAQGYQTVLGQWLELHLADFTVATILDRQQKQRAVPSRPAPTPGSASKGPYPTPPAPSPQKPAPAAPMEPESARAVRLYKQQYGGKPLSAHAKQWSPQVQSIFRTEGVPAELVWQAEVESSWNPSARSPVGAAGLFQFMPATAKELGLKAENPDERLDALLNAAAAARYLKRLHSRFGDWPLSLAAYNCGLGRVGKLQAATGKGANATFDDIYARLPAETKLYVPKIDALVQLRTGKSLAMLPAPR